jgi:hypothetical protein
MPLEHVYHADRRLLHFIGRGEITFRELADAILACNHAYPIAEDATSFIDFSAALVRMDASEQYQYQRFFVLLQDGRRNIRWVILAGPAETLACARQVHKWLASRNITVQITQDREEAVALVGGVDPATLSATDPAQG